MPLQRHAGRLIFFVKEFEMRMTALGQTGLMVSRLGIGMAALGRPGYITLGHADDLRHDYDREAMEAQAHAVLDVAWSLGIRYFDAARSYGDGERFLATWLAARGIPQHAVAVGSKWGYTYTAGWRVEAEKHEVKDHSLTVLNRQIAESRALLDGYLGLYQIHSATLESGVLENREVLNELHRLQGSGLRIGLSLTGPRQAETLLRARRIVVNGRRLFDCVQATWNLLEPSVGPALHEAHAEGLGIIVKESLANGRLTSRNDDPAFIAKRQVLERGANRLGASVDAFCLAAALAQPWADVVLSGAATVEQLRSNVRALDVPWDGQATEAVKEVAEEPEIYWGKRGALRWN